MIVYQTKHKTVKGISANKVLELAQDNWKKLPAWLKQNIQEDKILIAGTFIQVESGVGCRYRTYDTDVIFINDKNVLRVMKEADFLDTYEDPFAGK